MQASVSLACMAVPYKAKSASFFWAVFAISIGLQFIHFGPGMWYWIGHAVSFAPFFTLGLAIAASGHATPRNRWGGWTSLAAFLILFLATPFFADLLGAICLSLLLCLLAMWGAAALMALPVLGTLLASMGVGSMAIYLMHTIFSAASREVLLQSGVTGPGLHLVIGIITGLVLPLMIWHLLPRSANRLLGF